MLNFSPLIEIILRLRDTNYLEFLYFGFTQKIINEKFISDFSMQCLNKNILFNAKILEFAYLSEVEYIKITEIFEKSIDKENFELRKQKYNKLWFYLILAADLKTVGYIE